MRRVFQLKQLPLALLEAYVILAVSAVWMWCFAKFWTFMVIELPKDLGPYSQMSSLSMFMHRAFPMRETNDISFEYKFDHILMLACVMVVIMMAWVPTRREIKTKAGKKAAKEKKAQEAADDSDSDEEDTPEPSESKSKSAKKKEDKAASEAPAPKSKSGKKVAAGKK
eukprot:TRINITY_DN2620_c0_g1_i1.p1 TRINITY_DN2620_c0_g1~~TRINITY_DN2620_c0_g1_i1.p1  ORF type:complete len:168 (+),score=44.44 TRINITY_DN2620_c0_g1_i1:90-593(+)